MTVPSDNTDPTLPLPATVAPTTIPTSVDSAITIAPTPTPTTSVTTARVELIGEGDSIDYGPYISLVAALLVVFIGSWLASRQVRMQIVAAREDAATRWQRERDLEARKWEVSEKRIAYSDALVAYEAVITSVHWELNMASGGPPWPVEPPPLQRAVIDFEIARTRAMLVGSDAFNLHLQDISEWLQAVQRGLAVQDDSLQQVEKSWAAGTQWDRHRALSDLAQAEVRSL